MINSYGRNKQENCITLERDRFRPNWRRGEVLTQNCSFTYSPIYDKGTQNDLRGKQKSIKGLLMLIWMYIHLAISEWL